MRDSRGVLLGAGFCLSLLISLPICAAAQSTPDFPTGGTKAQPAQDVDQPATPGVRPWRFGFLSDSRATLLVSQWFAPAPPRSAGTAWLTRTQRHKVGR